MSNIALAGKSRTDNNDRNIFLMVRISGRFLCWGHPVTLLLIEQIVCDIEGPFLTMKCFAACSLARCAKTRGDFV